MSLTVDFLSILLIATLFQGLFFLSVLVFKDKLGEHRHRYLLLVILALMWYAAEFLSVRQAQDIRFNMFYGTRYGSWLLLGPIYYFYVRSVISEQPQPRSIIIHLAPFLIFMFLFPVLTSDIRSFQQVNYGMLSTFGPFSSGVSPVEYISSIVFIFQFFHLLGYLAAASKAVRVYERKLKGNYSTLDISNIRWLKVMSMLLLLILVLVTAFLALFFTIRVYDRNLDYLYVLPIALLIYMISYKLTGVQWPVPMPVEEKPGKYEKSGLKQEQADLYMKQLQNYMISTQPYLNNELRLQELAQDLGIPPHHLSQVINDTMKTTFFDLINWHRVEEAKRLIHAEKNSSLLEIAHQSGFNNKTSFTNAFKKNTGLTPIAYRKKEEKHHPEIK